MKKRILGLIAVLALPIVAWASVQMYNNAGTNLGVVNQIKCGFGLGCSIVAGKVVMQSAPAGQTSASSTTLTNAQCGRTFVANAASAMVLPEASTVPGCRYTFVNLSTGTTTVDVATGDMILILTNAIGDKISNATEGNSVTLEAVSHIHWVVIGEKGTWSDAN